MIFEPGAKLLISHRRLFELDHARFFAGLVDGYENGIVRVTGFTWTRDGYSGTFLRKPDERTKVISIASGTVLVYVLPSAVQMTSLAMCTEGTSVFLRDERGFEMDLTEGVLHAGPAALGETRSRRTA